MLWILLIVLVVISTPVKLIKFINNERSKYSISPITYNYSLHDELLEFNKTVGQDWFYNKSNYSYIVKEYNRVQDLNCQFLMLDNKFKDSGFVYMFRDTFKTNVLSIFKYRIKQKNCFNWKLCNKTKFNDFVSCLKDPSPGSVIGNSIKCSWGMYYLPKIMHRDLQQVACLSLDRQGPSTPLHLIGIQNKAFICYMKIKNPFTSDKIL